MDMLILKSICERKVNNQIYATLEVKAIIFMFNFSYEICQQPHSVSKQQTILITL